MNITNDAWYGRSSAPYQHLSMTVFRAVENRVPLIRAANTGITAIIDSKGHIRGMTQLFKEEYLTGESGLELLRRSTPDTAMFLPGFVCFYRQSSSCWRYRRKVRG